MIQALLFVAAAAATLSPVLQPHDVAVCESIDEAADQIAAAGNDVDQLLELASAWSADDETLWAEAAWKRVIELEPDHAGARKGLRHHAFEGKWYETYAALSKARRTEAKRRLDADGVVPFGGTWVKAEELPFHRMGWEPSEDGRWAPPGTKDRLADEAEKLANGWQMQHRTLVSPSEFDEWRGGLWKVGDEWLDTAAANDAHSKIGAWWEIPGDHFVALTTLPEEQARWAVWWGDQTHADLTRILGLEPDAKPEYVVLDSIAQYNSFAAGSTVDSRVPADASGFSSIHYAFFTDGWTDASGPSPVFRATGAAYYDVNDPALKAYGQHAVRHAAALAWLEAVDPSWNATSLMLTSPQGVFPDALYWGEKRIPRWLRYGIASYCERFFEDTTVGEGGDPLWARKWALENLAKKGPMDPIEEVLALEFITADPEASSRLMHEAGLVVHYLVDGSDKKLGKLWQAYREVLAEGEDVADAVADLEAAVLKASKKIASFGGL